MRETRFIEQMKDKWQSFETILKSPYKTPEKLYNLFVHILDDLSFARTFYPNRSVRVYLNGVAQQIFTNVYQKRKSNKRKLLTFWTEDMPRVMYDARSELLTSFLVFAISMSIGMLSCAMDDGFLEVILGNDYTEMTRENIRSGDPMRVYKQRGELSMSVGIAVNNLTVAFLTFVMGVFYTLGTFIVLISNGIMVGAFQYFFIKEGVFVESFLTIWIHGTLEISAIVIAGAAGIATGKGIVFPSTYSRLKSFQQSARRGLKIMMGIVPIIILAAFFEGFLTRQTETPDVIRGCFILICLVFVISYFVIYPRLYVRKYGFTPISVGKLVADKSLSVEWLKIKTDSDIIGDTFLLFRKHIARWVLIVLICAATYTTAAFLLTEDFSIAFRFPAQAFGTLSVLHQFFINDVPWMALVVMIPVILLTYLTFLYIHPPVQAHWLGALKLAVVVAVWYSIIAFTEGFSYLLVPFLVPIVLLWAATSYQETGNMFKTLDRTFQLLKKQYGKIVGLFLVLLLIGFIFFNILDTIVVNLFFEKITWVLPFEAEALENAGAFILTFITMTVIYFIFLLFLLSNVVLYFSCLEAKEAIQLLHKIEQIGNTKRIRGIEQETLVGSRN